MVWEISLSMGTGFVLAAWAVIGNDALQTVGTYLASNQDRTPKVVQMLFLCSITSGVMLTGWWLNHGDPAWGRLSAPTSLIPLPTPLGWVFMIPPLAVLALTRWGAPVSTSFLVLSSFHPANTKALLASSATGYCLAFSLGLVSYGLGTRWLNHWRGGQDSHGSSEGRGWLVLQWMATALLWSQWLIQDMANIFVYLPRQLSAGAMASCTALLCLGVCLLVASGGGPMQAILRSKRSSTDLVSATVIDMLFGLCLLVKTVISTVPLSTTWVFLGLLGGRELALRPSEPNSLIQTLGTDVGKAMVGVIVSLLIAQLLQPWIPSGVG
ncbi:MAG: hypothetical protein ACPHAS_06775 [Synechococcus sp.]